MTDDIYMDADGNREKVQTLLDVAGLGLIQVETFIDGPNHKMYTQISAIGQCTVQDLPTEFNLTTFANLAADPTSGVTSYIGEQPLPWSADELFYTFYISFGDIKETVYFCKKTKNLKWVTMEGKPYILHTEGQTAQKFTDTDFPAYLRCTPSEGFTLMAFTHPVHRRLTQ